MKATAPHALACGAVERNGRMTMPADAMVALWHGPVFVGMVLQQDVAKHEVINDGESQRLSVGTSKGVVVTGNECHVGLPRGSYFGKATPFFVVAGMDKVAYDAEISSRLLHKVGEALQVVCKCTVGDGQAVLPKKRPLAQVHITEKHHPFVRNPYGQFWQ